jgi:hypothetical protein
MSVLIGDRPSLSIGVVVTSSEKKWTQVLCHSDALNCGMIVCTENNR